eukprot:4079197-Amphidinium_carterae.1
MSLGSKTWHSEVPTLLEGQVRHIPPTRAQPKRMFPDCTKNTREPFHLRTFDAFAWGFAVGFSAGGCSWGGKQAGVERGQLYKQARTAQRLNSERKASGEDDEALKSQLTGLKRLLNMTQTLEPNADPSKNSL